MENKETEQSLREKAIQAAMDYYDFKFGGKREFKYIPPSGKLLDGKDLANMIDASLDLWLTAGRFCDEFERRFAQYLGAKYALAVNSGSSANLLALTALTSHKLGERQLKKGDEVITVAAGFPTTVAPIVQNGLVPVFVDCGKGTYNIDTDKIEEAISPKTKAVFIAHTLGNMFDIARIKEICEKHNMWLIEDSCDALGAEWQGRKAGTIGDIGTFSFYPAHHMTMGEGGAVCTSNAVLHRALFSIRDWGRDCWCKPGTDNTCGNRFKMKHGNMPQGYDHKYIYSHLGYNLKITDWQAAIGLSQLEKLPSFLKKRAENAAYLTESLKDLENVLILPAAMEGTKPSWFGYLISVKENAPFTKQQLVEYIEAKGIGTRQLFAGNLLRQPAMTYNEVLLRIGSGALKKSCELAEAGYASLPETEFIMNNSFWVGTFPALGRAETDRISQAIHEFIKNKA
ncbi:MAG: lipopolysaccharide biosynthesis protein RfbH [Elusimicrobiales bacterium]|nr:lipopolysaccharide biosynthesis protein RfbH [Elusimicrobiales bacterium]